MWGKVYDQERTSVWVHCFKEVCSLVFISHLWHCLFIAAIENAVCESWSVEKCSDITTGKPSQASTRLPAATELEHLSLSYITHKCVCACKTIQLWGSWETWQVWCFSKSDLKLLGALFFSLEDLFKGTLDSSVSEYLAVFIWKCIIFKDKLSGPFF